jgi:Fe2+/Zn2+ uptake regulation proteins
MEARKFSRKREAILDALRSTKTHPTAEWIYATLKPLYPDLSLGTVYRNLSLFRSEGQIISVGTVNGQERFDANIAPHPHFICDSCGEVIDIDDSFYQGSIKKPSGFDEGEINWCEVVFHGKCLKCLK